MRIDHFAYQRATQVAGFGFFVQLAIALALLLFGVIADDTPMVLGSIYVFAGLLVWLSLIVLFHQHKLERLEALEETELAAARTGSESIFQGAGDQRVAARRLRLMHQWLMPIMTLVIVIALGLGAYGEIRYLTVRRELTEAAATLTYTDSIGWALSICLALSAAAFIFSRFVAGMAKQPAWQNLRGGAGYMVGNALVLLALAVGHGFRFFKNDDVIEVIAKAMPYFMIAVAAEFLLNLVLNLYRPRIAGEVPRPAFDSRVLSLLAAPDSLVRSINEAVNYQFGFDITSSWGYQLLLRSVTRLAVLGLIVLILLNTMVIVEPHQQAIRVRGGQIVGDEVHQPGILWKLPWPFETAETYDVTHVKELELTPRIQGPGAINEWASELKVEGELRPFLVGASRHAEAVKKAVEEVAAEAEPSEDAGLAGADEARLAAKYSLVDAQIIMNYRIRPDRDGLLDYLRFASEARMRRQGDESRIEAVKALALREATQQMAAMSLEDVLSGGRLELGVQLRERIQASLDEHRAGLEVVAVNVPMVRPHGTAGQAFEELDVARQARREFVANAESEIARGLAAFAGDARMTEALNQAIDQWQHALPGTENAKLAQALLERQLAQAGGEVAYTFTEGTTSRLVTYMTARAKATETLSQWESYKAAPRLFRQRLLLEAFADALQPMRKIFTGIDAERLSIRLQFKELDPVMTPDISDTSGGSIP